jgi:hypothetical protein
VFVRMLENKISVRLMQPIQLENPDSSLIAALSALRATRRMPGQRRDMVAPRFQPLYFSRSGWFLVATNRTKPTNETLRNDQVEGGSYLVVNDAEITEGRDDACRIASVECAQKSVSAVGGIQRCAGGAWSRISPMKMRSGSSRSIPFTPSAKLSPCFSLI